MGVRVEVQRHRRVLVTEPLGDDVHRYALSQQERGRRARASGSKPFVKCVSDPLASTTNGSRPSMVTARFAIDSGRPSAYIADCHSTPLSVVPCGLASITPTARRSTYSR